MRVEPEALSVTGSSWHSHPLVCQPVRDHDGALLSQEVRMDSRSPSVEVAPLQSKGLLYGFLLSGRWPQDTVEWAKFLVLAVQMAAVPGLVRTSTVFRVCEELPDQPQPGAVGLVVAEGQLIGESPLRPGRFADHQPPGLIVLHPPSSTLSSVPEYEVASGCLFLPGKSGLLRRMRNSRSTAAAARGGVCPSRRFGFRSLARRSGI